MRKILSGRRGSGRGRFQMVVNTAIQTQYKNTPSATNQFYFPIVDGTDSQGYTISFTIDWGDGQTSNVDSSNYATECLHTYLNPGTYTVSAEGNIAGFCFWNVNTPGKDDGKKLLEITQWGDLKLTGGEFGTAGQIFRQCSNLVQISAPDTPWFPLDVQFNSLNSKGGRGTFSGCSSLSTINNIGNWNVGTCNTLEIMFSGCSKLQYGTNALGPLAFSQWDVSNCFRFERMFNGCSVMNAKMFTNVGANTGTSSLDFERMFYDCDVFDNVNSGSMNGWIMDRATNMRQMFENCAIFDDDITAWDTQRVTTMFSMFENALSFNQDISGWDTANVVDMRNMFKDTSAFDQPIGNWNVDAWNVYTVGNTPLTNASSTFTLSTVNYDALLIAWDAYNFASWPGGTVDFGNSQYSLGNPSVVSARSSLATKWGILNDGGGI